MAVNFTPLGSEIQVNTLLSGSQYWTDVAATTDGRFFVTFATNPSDPDIYGRFVSANGVATGDVIAISNDGADNAGFTEIDASVARRANGGVAVVYVSNNLAGGSDFDIYLRTVSASGDVSHGPTNEAGLEVAGVSIDTGRSLVNPDVATLLNGQTLVVWSAIYSGIDRDIHARFLNAAGDGFVTSYYQAVDGTSSSVSDYPSVAASGNNALVVYQDSRDGFTNDIRCVFYNGATNSFTGLGTGAGKVVADLPNRSVSRPDVAALADGRYVVVWTEEQKYVQGRFVDAGGNPVGGVFAISTYQPSEAYIAGVNDYPRVAALPDGGLLVTWDHNGSFFESGDFFPDHAVHGRRFDASGAPAGDLFLVNTDSPNTDQGVPAIAVNPATGRAFIVWEDGRAYPEDGSPLGIRGRAFDPTTDVVNGTTLDDTITTYSLSETIRAVRGNDTVNARGGSDAIDGGLGNDRLTGGPGGDSFLFTTKLNKKSNLDHITDFEPGVDTIVLDQGVFPKLKLGELKAKAFLAKENADEAKDGKDRIVYDTKSGEAYWDKDGKGGAKAKLFAVLDGSPDGVGSGDFVVVA